MKTKEPGCTHLLRIFIYVFQEEEPKQILQHVETDWQKLNLSPNRENGQSQLILNALMYECEKNKISFSLEAIQHRYEHKKVRKTK